ncbi:MAG: hypothetical protein IJB63_01230 [Alistipes sp.]|nr:hypothetical protein [Alistipes sp.]
MKAFVKFMMCAAVLMGSVVFSSCSKDDDEGDRKTVNDGIMATHKFYITPDLLKFVDVTVEWTDFEGKIVTEKVTPAELVLEREYITEKLQGSTAMTVYIERNSTEIDKDGEYDIALTYDFSAIRLFGSNGTGKPITTGQPIEQFREKHVNIHKTFLESILNRIPKEVSIINMFNDTPFGVQCIPVVECSDEKVGK